MSSGSLDIFGSSRGRISNTRGKRGPPGRPGGIRDLCKWLPRSTLSIMQKHEMAACYLLQDPTDITKEGKSVKIWNSRSETKHNLIAVKPTSTIVDLPKGKKALSFTKNQYQSHVELIQPITGAGFLCLTFKTDKDELQTIVGKFQTRDLVHQNFEIQCSGTEIFVCGYSDGKYVEMPIMNDCRKWCTLYLGYTISTSSELTIQYMMNGDIDTKGQILLNAAKMSQPMFTLGCRKNETQYFSGQISALEIYFVENQREFIPDEIAMLVSTSQKI